MKKGGYEHEDDFTLSEGLEYCVQKRVAYEDTTVSFGRAGIETLFSTTALVGMMIEAAVELVGKKCSGRVYYCRKKNRDNS